MPTHAQHVLDPDVVAAMAVADAVGFGGPAYRAASRALLKDPLERGEYRRVRAYGAALVDLAVAVRAAPTPVRVPEFTMSSVSLRC